MSNNEARVRSCGEILLYADPRTFDFTLILTSDGKNKIPVQCHRCVLQSHSPALRQLITAENFYTAEIKVLPGFIAPFLELINYMYIKDPKRITQVEKVLQLCAFLDMSIDHFWIRARTAPIRPVDVEMKDGAETVNRKTTIFLDEPLANQFYKQ